MRRIYSTINIIHRFARPAASLLNLKLADVLVLALPLAPHRGKDVFPPRRQGRAIHSGVAVAVGEFNLTQRAAARGAMSEITTEAVTRLQAPETGIYEV